MRRFKLLIAAAALAFAATTATAQQGMRAVGSVTYTPRPVGEQVGVFTLRPEDRLIRALRIEAAEGTALLVELRLIFRSGATERIRLQERLRPGTLSNLIRSRDPEPIRQVEVIYIPEGRVTLVLRADTGPPAPPPPPPKPVVQWTELGCKSVGFLIDRDILNVNSRELYRALRLRSKGFPIEMIDLGVTYSNGQRDVFRVNQTIPAGGFTGPIDLRGERRRIGSVELVYQTKVLSNQKTILCVDGLQFRSDE